MTRFPAHMRVIAFLAAAAFVTMPVYGEALSSGRPDDGFTRDGFAESNAPARTAPPSPARTHSKRTRLDSKDFLSVHHVAQHHGHGRKHGQVASAAPAPRHRGPVIGFVYWWNGWVLRTFHTRVGTVMLGKIGAKS